MQSLSSNENAPRRRSRITLWLILAVCAAPVIAAYVAYYVWQPSGHVNYGELLAPHSVTDIRLGRIDGGELELSQLRGEWVLVAADSAACDERCRMKLVYMRQVRLAEGAESKRIERVWLVTDAGAPDPKLLAEHAGLHVLRANTRILAALPAVKSAANHIYVIDPQGNLMMRFPPDPDPRRILRDMSRLLRHSKWK